MSNSIERRRLLGMGLAGVGVAGLGLKSTPAQAQVCSGFGYLFAYSATSTDYSTAIEAAIASVVGVGGGYILFENGVYPFSRPIVVPSGVSLIGESARSDSTTAGTVFIKRKAINNGFSGDALIRIEAVSNVLIKGIAVCDTETLKQPGHGISIVGATGNVVLDEVSVIGHKAWGLSIASSKRCSVSGLTCIGNAQGEVGAGGVKIDNSSDCRIADSRISSNAGVQLLATTAAGSSGAGATALSVVACRIEAGSASLSSTPVVQIDQVSCSTFTASTFSRGAQNVSCVQLGGNGSPSNVTLASCTLEFSNPTSTVAPVKLLGATTTTAISLIDLRYSSSSSVLIDASGLTAGSVPKVFVSAVPPLTTAQRTAAANVIAAPVLATL